MIQESISVLTVPFGEERFEKRRYDRTVKPIGNTFVRRLSRSCCGSNQVTCGVEDYAWSGVTNLRPISLQS